MADVLVVNKADRDGADRTTRELRAMLTMAADTGWRPPWCAPSASRGEGIDELLAAVAEHREWLASSGEGARRRRLRAAREIEAIAVRRAAPPHGGRRRRAAVDALAERVVAGECDPWTAADELVGRL